MHLGARDLLTTRFTSDWEDVSLKARGAQAREPRVPVKHSIEVCGFDRHGHFFTERSMTTDVSESGCDFDLHREVERDSIIAIRVINHRFGREIDSQPILFKIARMEPCSIGWTLVGSKLQPGGPCWVEITELSKIPNTNS